MAHKNNQKLKATPELEDFRGKYESGKVGSKLLDQYFIAVKQLLDESKLTKGRAIEIGCGEGLSTQRLVAMLPKNLKLEASEYVAHQIPDAKKNNPGVTITQESVYELKHKDNSFNVVFLLEVLEHLDYPDKALIEIKRVIKPGGYLILGVPREPLWRGLNMLRGKYLKDLGNTPGHLNHWSSRGLVKFISNNFGIVGSIKQPLPWTITLTKKT